MEVCATLQTWRISKPVSAGLFDCERIRVKFFRWAHVQFCDKYLVWQAPFHEPQHPRKLHDCVLKQFHLERERKGGNYWLCIRDISEQTQNHHTFLWSRLGHEIDDEHDLDSEDEHLVDKLMVFNVDNDTSDVSDTDE